MTDVYLAILQRIEDKLDALLAALADEDVADDEHAAPLSLDGTPAGAERASGQSL